MRLVIISLLSFATHIQVARPFLFAGQILRHLDLKVRQICCLSIQEIVLLLRVEVRIQVHVETFVWKLQMLGHLRRMVPTDRSERCRWP